jgi:hypothetical protein
LGTAKVSFTISYTIPTEEPVLSIAKSDNFKAYKAGLIELFTNEGAANVTISNYELKED